MDLSLIGVGGAILGDFVDLKDDPHNNIVMGEVLA